MSDIQESVFDSKRQQAIHEKGFGVISNYGRIKVGSKTLDDATLNLGSLQRTEKNLGNKAFILKALNAQDIPTLRRISNYFYRTSGIYERICNTFSNMYRYDWYIVPEVYDDKLKEDKILKDFQKVLNYLDNSYIKKTCCDIALKVIKDGAYYGYKVATKDGLILQELPVNYCRSHFNIGHLPAIEFNMKFFDDCFPDVNYRMRVIKMFPPEFAKGYVLYKQSKLKDTCPTGDCHYHCNISEGWYLLTPGNAIKFNFNNSDVPLFVNACPAILDLNAAQDLDRRKQMQQLLKILIQKLPMDKNNDLVFDVDEARDIHNNAVEMLRHTIGVDVLTTFADIESIDLSDKNTSTTKDDLEKVERTVYNEFGVSSGLFNTTSNMALEKSILNDESYMRPLLLQMAVFFDSIVQQISPNKSKARFRLYMLETTQYNYKEMSKLYKEQVQIGYSKMLPQIALGHSQSSIINTAYFENEVLHLSEIMIPPLMSSTLNGQDILGKNSQTTQNKTQKSIESSNPGGGRPEKPDGQKSDKTIANKQSMS